MSGNSRNCSSYFDAQERDGEIKGLSFLDQTQRDTEGNARSDLHFLDLESGEVSDVLGTTPPDLPCDSFVVTCGNHAYALGGSLFRGCCCTRKGLLLRGTNASFGEVYDVSGDIWVPLRGPSSISKYSEISYPALLNSSRSRILVHFRSGRSRSLYAYYYDDKSWVCVDPKFLNWSPTVGILDNMLYVFSEFDSRYRLSKKNAYDVNDKKWLPVELSSEFSLKAPPDAPLIHLSNDNKCFEHIIFRMLRNRHGGIYAIGEGRYRTSAPFRRTQYEILLP